jgi:radical SAM protein with 4Fe4S-binding SPASM domain
MRFNKILLNTAVRKVNSKLPIFIVDTANYSVFYTPGQFAVVDRADAPATVCALNGAGNPDETSVPKKVSRWLIEQANIAVASRQEWINAPFEPQCLTLYLSNYCNLDCTYCYASGKTDQNLRSSRHNMPVMRGDVVLAAAKRVARNCARTSKPFSLVLHGGGEPTVHWEQVEKFVEITREIADRFKIDWFGYIATNGVLPENRVRWLARHFGLIGLSCDGPPDIQDDQRPLLNGAKSSPFIERTARILNEAGGKFQIRATITPGTISRQVDIVSYLHGKLGATSIRFEPAYRLKHKKMTGFEPQHADIFVEHFLAAQHKARFLGCDLSFSGVRPDEIHGSYCNVLRNALHITPDGGASACFFCTDTKCSSGKRFKIGYYNKETGDYVVDPDRIERHRRAASQIPEYCHDCFSIFHCARGCPDLCALDNELGIANRPQPSQIRHVALFRCRVQKRLALSHILTAAEKAIRNEEEQIEVSSSRRPSAANAIPAHLSNSFSNMENEAILAEHKALSPRYTIEKRQMPAPIWARRGFAFTGGEAWPQLTRSISRQGANRHLSIYVHIPFCNQKCIFCDCYAFPLGRNKSGKDDRYVQALVSEIKAFSQIHPLSLRPVTTIHFGGGTPNCIRPALMERVVNSFRKHFNISPETEWALESTGMLIGEGQLDLLRQWGFRRLHVGVQTLSEPLRQQIGRKAASKKLMQNLDCAMEKGFITSVDAIFGLPQQTMENLLDTLDTLSRAGIHGVSLYRLNISRRNQLLFRKFGNFKIDAVYDFSLYQAADRFLISGGYSKNHFAHFAKEQDRNLYFTHAKRGEDLLAIGATADGLFGHYHYRHPGYARYIKGIDLPAPVLEGGLYESIPERRLRPAIAELMGSDIRLATMEDIHAEQLLTDWLEFALIRQGLDKEKFILTSCGSWFIDTMINELRDFISIRQGHLSR